MLDPKLIRENLALVAENIAKRHIKIDWEKISQLEKMRKASQAEVQSLQAERNDLAKQIGALRQKNADTTELMQRAAWTAEKLKMHLDTFEKMQQELQAELEVLPNLLHESVPIGQSESDNVLIRQQGVPKKFDFEVKDHVALGEALKQMDFASASKITGARFVVLTDQLARLHRALIQFMLDLHTQEHGYQEVYVPYLVNHDSLFGTGQLPKFAGDLFHTREPFAFSLIPTAEVPVTNLVRDTILEEADLPLKLVAHTPCFRSEAGSYGKDTRGMIRQHQFEKVELVQIVKPENSYEAHEELTHHAEKVLQLLELPYRVMLLCSADTGFGSAKTHDLEVWLPSQNTYREISSCSNFESYQARRMQARYRNSQTKKSELVHTLNGSGLAVGRTLVAILENYQQKNGDIVLPDVLRKYFAADRIYARGN